MIDDKFTLYSLPIMRLFLVFLAAMFCICFFGFFDNLLLWARIYCISKCRVIWDVPGSIYENCFEIFPVLPNSYAKHSYISCDNCC